MDISRYISGVHAFAMFSIATLTSLALAQEPIFTTQPVDSQVIGGSSVFLRCSVANAVGSVQWTRDGFALGTDRTLPGYPRYNIHGAAALGEYDLFISNAQLEDDAIFQCQIGATEDTPGKVSNQAKLNVLLAPDTPFIDGAVELGINRYSLEVTEGVAYNITCHANHGKPAPTVNWLANGQAVTEGVTYQKVERPGDKREDAIGRIQITPKKEDQGKQYECRVKNAALNTAKHTRVYLKVLYAPEVTMTADPSRKVREGGTVTFTCEAPANPSEVTWKWLVGGEEVADATGSVYEMSDVSRDMNAKEVTCQATNTVGTKAQTHTLNVEYAPYFTEEPESVPAEPDDDVTLRCSVAGNPVPSLVWTKAGSVRILSRNDELLLPTITGRDFGAYRCTASSIDFPQVHRDVHVLRKGPPKITSSRQQSARLGETAAIECKSVSVPEPDSIVWSRDDKPINVDGNKRYSVREEDSRFGKKSILEIQSSQNKDFGQINCTVTNSYGSATHIIQFTKEEVVSLTYILLGVLLSVAFIIIALIIVYVLYRRRKTDSEYGSDSSENTLQKKDNNKPEITHITHDSSGPVDAWANSTVKTMYDEQGLRRPYHGNNYDDVYTAKPYGNDYSDGFGNRGYATSQPVTPTSNPYGTFPRPAHNPQQPRYAASDYGGPTSSAQHYPTDSGTYGRSRTPQPYHNYTIRPTHPYAGSDYGGGGTLPRGNGIANGVSLHAPAKLDSRLATNV